MAINYFQELGLNSYNPAQALSQGQAYKMNQFNLDTAKAQEAERIAMNQQKEQAAQIKFANDQQKAKAAQTAGMFYNALNSGDIEGAKAIVIANSADVNSLGDPSFTSDRIVKMLDTPEGVKQLTGSALGIIQMAGGPEQFAKFTESQQVKPMTAYERAQIDNERNKSKQKPFEQGTGNASGFVFDPNTGSYTPNPAILQNIADAKAKLDAEGKTLDAKTIVTLNKDISTITKDADMIHNTAKDVSALRKLGGGPASIAIVYKFMKSLDPTSVVREGEFATAANAGGVPDNIMNAYNRLLEGERLPEDVIADFEIAAKELANSASDSATGAVDLYLATFEDQMPDSLREKLKARVPKRFEVVKKDEVKTGSANKLTPPVTNDVSGAQVVDWVSLPQGGGR